MRIRSCLRRLNRDRSFTLTVVAVLALTIGFATVLSGVADAGLARPFVYPRLQELVRVAPSRDSSEYFRRSDLPLISQSGVFRTVTTVRMAQFQIDGGRLLESVPGAFVSGSYLETYGVQPVRGRGFAPQDHLGRATVSMLGERYWRHRYASDPGVIGRSILLRDGPLTIIGVLPASLLTQVAVVLPESHKADGADTAPRVTVIARLPTEVPVDIAQQRLQAIPRGTRTGRSNDGPVITPIGASYVSTNQRTVLVVAVGIVLIMVAGCLNSSGLILNRAWARCQDFTVMMALGATRQQLITEIAAECGILTWLGGGVGLILADLSLRTSFAATILRLPEDRLVSVDLRMVAAALVLSALAAALAGVIPALLVTQNLVGAGVLHSTRVTPGPGIARWKRVTIGAQVAATTVLLGVAGAIGLNHHRLASVDLGVQLADVKVFRVVPEEGPPERSFYPSLVRGLRETAGVADVGAVDHVPLSGNVLKIDGRAVTRSVGAVVTEPKGGWDIRHVLPGYFEALRIQLVHGRLPKEADLSGANQVVVLNRTAALSAFGREAISGEAIFIKGEPFVVVGVVGDTRHNGPQSTPSPEVDLVRAAADMSLIVRSASEEDLLMGTISSLARVGGQRVVVSPIVTASDLSERHLVAGRSRAMVFGALAIFSLALVVVGGFAVAAQDARQRAAESAIRTALGASPAQLVFHMLTRTLVSQWAGMGAGLVALWMIAPQFPPSLADLARDGVGLMAAVASFLVLATGAAAWLPIRRSVVRATVPR